MAKARDPYREPDAPAPSAAPDRPCAKCKAPTPPSALTLSLDGRGWVCPSCHLAAVAAQNGAGERGAYAKGSFRIAAELVREWVRRRF
jgi:hypothetical protein